MVRGAKEDPIDFADRCKSAIARAGGLVDRVWDGNLKVKSWFLKNILRVVQTQSILFLKSMSENVGSVIERLWNSMTSHSIDFETIQIWVIIENSESWYAGSESFRQWFQKKWIGSELPLMSGLNVIQLRTWAYQIFTLAPPSGQEYFFK